MNRMRLRNKQHKGRLKGFTLTELLVVLVIIGILVLIALPNFQGIIDDAYATEAQTQLRHIKTLQDNYRYKKSKYCESLEELGFEAPVLVDQGGESRYEYQITTADKGGFTATATAVVDFDNDGQMNMWQVTQATGPEEKVKD